MQVSNAGRGTPLAPRTVRRHVRPKDSIKLDDFDWTYSDHSSSCFSMPKEMANERSSMMAGRISAGLKWRIRDRLSMKCAIRGYGLLSPR